MTSTEIVRSWKDENYLSSLSAAERTFLPVNPVGLTELTDEQLLGIEGGTSVTVAECVAISAASVFGVSMLAYAVSYIGSMAFQCR
jgi:mersacidin/lichenicidin family type 2 lantibiotic